MSLPEPSLSPWRQIVQGAVSLACTAQRIPVIATGRAVFASVFGKQAHHGLGQYLRKHLVEDIQQVIDRDDDYEFNLLIWLLETHTLTDELQVVAQWGLTSDNLDVIEYARKALVEVGT